MKAISLLIISSLFFICNIDAQKVIPNNFSPEERSQLGDYTVPKSRTGFSIAPTNSNLRTAAEWEEMRGTVISWAYFTNFLTDIVEYAQEEGFVYIFCSDSNSVKSTLQSNSIPLNNIRCIQESTNSVWIRDFGPNNVYFDEVGDMVFVDWVYNRNRPLDDLSPESLANYLNIDVYNTNTTPTDLVNTGGNFMTDGLGNSFASNLVMEENETTSPFNSTPKTEAEVDQIMQDFMGIDSYIKMPVLPHDDIHHIDMHMKLLDEETLLVGEYPDGISDGPQIEINLQYILDNYNSAFGTPYKVVRIDMPIGQTWGGSSAWPSNGGSYKTYTNSLIINKKVLVPIYNDATANATALAVYEEAMPGYQIIGIDASEPIPSSGAIHCTTHEIAIDNPLWIVHQAIEDQDEGTISYEISAQIKHRDGIDNAKVFYELEGNPGFTSTDMTYISDDTWTGSIPQQPTDSEVHYYIEATANSAKVMTRPLPAPDAYWTFNVLNSTDIIEVQDLFKLKYYNKNEQLHVYYTTQDESKMQIGLYDLNGKYIRNIFTGNSQHGVNQHYINTNYISKGLYFIRARINNQSFNKKVIIE